MLNAPGRLAYRVYRGLQRWEGVLVHSMVGVLVPRPPHTGTTKRTTCSHASSLLDRVVFCACVPSDIEQITRKWLLLQGVAHSERVQGMSIARPVYSASRRVSALGRF